MISLSATFEKSNGRKHTWRMKNADPTKSAAEIKTSLEKLTTLDIFEQNGVNFTDKVVTAKFIETNERWIIEKKPKERKKRQTKAPKQETAPVQAISKKKAEHPIQDPKKLILQQRQVIPGMQEILFELPKGLEPQNISQSEALELVAAILPEDGILEDFCAIEGTHPIRFRLLVKLEDEKKVSSPPKEKTRDRLMERLKRRLE